MKTPREILLAQHRAAGDKLDKIRDKFVAGLNHRDTKAQSSISVLASWYLGGSNAVWRELIFPRRRIWAGLAAIWILIFIVNFSQRDKSELAVKALPSPEIFSTFQQQEKLLAELIGPSGPRVAEPPKPFLPKPRTEILKLLTA
ncbi:MAG TPA: hypothetical protein VHG71_08665 [Verrucomicrobiae bacterium]|nr:hypothetical protein [Verrucomicrobiae bacterium]